MTTVQIIEQVEQRFADVYNHFKELQHRPEYSRYWDKCIESLANRDLLVNIIFCNDTFEIPPVKTFLTIFREDFIEITWCRHFPKPPEGFRGNRSILGHGIQVCSRLYGAAKRFYINRRLLHS